MDKLPAGDAASEAPRTEDDEQRDDLAKVTDNADEKSDAGEPTTDHDPAAWRSEPPAKP